MKRLTETERATLLNALKCYQDTCDKAKMAANTPRLRESFITTSRQCEVLAAQIEQADGIGLEGING